MLECKGLRVDICNAQKVTVDLRDRLEVSQATFEKESYCVEKLSANLATQNWSEAAELARWKNQLVDCKAVQTLELEREKKLVAAQTKLVGTEATVQHLT